jgi:hypothetical protein
MPEHLWWDRADGQLPHFLDRLAHLVSLTGALRADLADDSELVSTLSVLAALADAEVCLISAMRHLEHH